MKTPVNQDPKIIYSRYSGLFERNGHSIEVCIFRFEAEVEWSLEVIDTQQNSTIWNEKFRSDVEAWGIFLRTIEVDGIESFVPPRG